MTRQSYYPVFLDLRGRRCAVFGSGEVAAEKAQALRDAGARVLHLRRGFRAGDLSGVSVAVDASEDVPSRPALRAEADREGVLLNVVDAAPWSDWIAPAVVRRGPLQVAVSTSGESPFLAATLRSRLEEMLGEEWGPLTLLIGSVRRRLRRRGVAPDAQRWVYRRLLRSEAPSLLRRGRRDEARALASAIERAARSHVRRDAPGEVVLVGAGPGDPGLLTIAAREVLGDADWVFHDALVDPRVIALCGTHARIVDAGKRAGTSAVDQAGINAAMIAAAHAGNLVVRLKGGDPLLFGRGGEEIEALTAAGLAVRVVPGVSAALAAPAAAGIPLTHRGVAGSVGIVTGQRSGGRDGDVERVARTTDTLVVLMPADLDALSARLVAVLGPDRPAAVISRATTPQQRVVAAPLAAVAGQARAAGLQPPCTLVVGEVVRSRVASAHASPETEAAR